MSVVFAYNPSLWSKNIRIKYYNYSSPDLLWGGASTVVLQFHPNKVFYPNPYSTTDDIYQIVLPSSNNHHLCSVPRTQMGCWQRPSCFRSRGWIYALWSWEYTDSSIIYLVVSLIIACLGIASHLTSSFNYGRQRLHYFSLWNTYKNKSIPEYH